MDKAPYIRSIKIALFVSLPFFLIFSIMDSNLNWEKFTHGTLVKAGWSSLILFMFIVSQRLANDYRELNGLPIQYSSNHSSSDESNVNHFSHDGHNSINPASGLPMVGGQGGVDIAGNPFGSSHH